MIHARNVVTEAATSPQVVGEGLLEGLDHGYNSGTIVSPPRYNMKDMKFKNLGRWGLRVPIFSYGGSLSVGSVANGAAVKELMQVAWDHVSITNFVLSKDTFFIIRKTDPSRWTYQTKSYYRVVRMECSTDTRGYHSCKNCNLNPPVLEQPQYSLLNRERFEVEYNPIFKNLGHGSTIWSPLKDGILTGKYNDGIPAGSRMDVNKEYLKTSVNRLLGQEGQEEIKKVKKLTQLAKEKLNCSVAQLALAWAASNPHVSTVILGATKPEQLRENFGALKVGLLFFKRKACIPFSSSSSHILLVSFDH
ncbi:hypothetical protein PSHT_06326 [Puccinia striiformis]|uniref:NADP-dependent oxidoreductase domain-containing protein n=1 Tax=Puccinia striiformis TaxID=27350 RepID=A0A2S4W6S8_9BASI|nr:hypothetical protein PSHT_06326 [Puccinia striiformis]